MKTIHPVIQLAKERALFRMTALAHPMLKDAIAGVNAALAQKPSDAETEILTEARLFLRENDTAFVDRFGKSFAALLETAIATMCNDERQSIDKFSGQEFTLIDDKIVHDQIEIDRLLRRLRKSDDADINQINIIIAQLHQQDDVNERENPFRPFLIARALYDVLGEMAEDKAVSSLLLEFLSSAMAQHLAEYYSAIRDVFDANGLHAKLSARPSRAFRQLSLSDADDGNVPATGEPSKPRVLSGLQRMQSYMPQAQTSPGSDNPPEQLQQFVRSLFNQAASHASPDEMQLEDDPAFRQEGTANTAPGAMVLVKSAELLAKLNQLQKLAAESHGVNEPDAGQKNQLFSVAEQIDTKHTTTRERTTIDLVAMLFEFILEDEQIPELVRGQLARLQIPFLKAAMLTPDVLHNAKHPARLLLNRMSSTAMGLDLETPVGHKLADEMARIVKIILYEFNDDVALFSTCLAELELFLEENLRNTDAKFALSVEALDAAEKGIATTVTSDASLQELLGPLNLDQRVNDFISKIWIRVINREAADPQLNIHARFRKLLPELIWSVQTKRSSERSELMRLLPDLVIWLKAGLTSIKLQESDAKQTLDQFVGMHMDVLRGQMPQKNQQLMSLNALRLHFEALHVTPDSNIDDTTPNNDRPPGTEKVEAKAIIAALKDRGVMASLDLGTEDMPKFETDADWLSQMVLGVCVERWGDGVFEPARLNWISKKKILFIFMVENSTKPAVYSDRSLIKCLREGSIRTIESAPAFDRAVQSLLNDAESLQADQA